MANPEQAVAGDGDAPAAVSGPNRRVRIGLAVGVLVVLLALAVWAFSWWTHGRFIESTNDAYLQADMVTVAPRVAGYVDQVFVADNAQVTVGQPLVRIEARDSQAKLEQAQAQVDQGVAAIAQAQAQIKQQQAQVDQVQAQLAAAKSTLAFASHEVDRYNPLAQSGAETHEHLDQLRQNRDQAKAQAAAAAAQLVAAQRQIGILQAQIGVTQAQIEQSRAEARQNRVDVDDSIVRASINGRVGDRSVRVGQYVAPGTKMMSVAPVQDIYLLANFKETQLAHMRAGQPVSIKVDALGGQTLHGVVDSFAPGTGAQFSLLPPSNATGNFTKIVQRVSVRIRLEAPPDVRARLLPGLSVEAAVDTHDAGSGR